MDDSHAGRNKKLQFFVAPLFRNTLKVRVEFAVFSLFALLTGPLVPFILSFFWTQNEGSRRGHIRTPQHCRGKKKLS